MVKNTWECQICFEANAAEASVCGNCDAPRGVRAPGSDTMSLPAHDLIALADSATSPLPLVRTYRGRQQGDALRAYQADAAELAKAGYAPTIQSWAPGQWGGGAFLVALALCIVLVGILVFVYMLVVKPEGTLTVTYGKSGTAVQDAAHVEATPSGRLTLADRLAQLDSARSRGLVTPAEYDQTRTGLLRNL
jgi:hypothetical protein